MYEPKHFKIEDKDQLFGVIRAYPLGLLITQGEGGIEANPIPFTLAVSPEGRDLLTCHLSRANPQWQAIGEGCEALVVFQGLDHYVTPEWYPSKKEHGKTVPTWNYVHVQARGIARVRDDLEFLRTQIEALTGQHEAGRATPWKVSDAPEAYTQAQMRGIVGVEIEISALSGKFKLSQNRQEADRNGVIDGLSQETNAAGPAMSELMRALTAGRQPDKLPS